MIETALRRHVLLIGVLIVTTSVISTLATFTSPAADQGPYDQLREWNAQIGLPAWRIPAVTLLLAGAVLAGLSWRCRA